MALGALTALLRLLLLALRLTAKTTRPASGPRPALCNSALAHPCRAEARDDAHEVDAALLEQVGGQDCGEEEGGGGEGERLSRPRVGREREADDAWEACAHAREPGQPIQEQHLGAAKPAAGVALPCCGCERNGWMQ